MFCKQTNFFCKKNSCAPLLFFPAADVLVKVLHLLGSTQILKFVLKTKQKKERKYTQDWTSERPGSTTALRSLEV